MARRRRKFDIFSMSFLDTICCAFGAIVLLYMILNAAGSRVFQKDTSQLRAEVDKLEEVGDPGFEGGPRVDSRADRREALHGFLGGLGVIPEAGRGGLLFERGCLGGQSGDVKAAP